MKLVFIRHGSPNYAIDSLTEKGFREAECLAKRAATWNVTEYYCSPYGRAQKTMEAITKVTGRKPITKDWLQEFDYRVTDPSNGNKRMAWDWMPQFFYSEKQLFDARDWFNHPVMQSGDIKAYYEKVCNGFDEILLSYGYKRKSFDNPLYECQPHLTKEEAAIDTHLLDTQKNLDDRTLVFVCHLGVMFVIFSHLMGVSPVPLWQGMFVAPTSVSVLGAEERVPGNVVFRLQTMGDVNHLVKERESPSASGFFGSVTYF